ARWPPSVRIPSAPPISRCSRDDCLGSRRKPGNSARISSSSSRTRFSSHIRRAMLALPSRAMLAVTPAGLYCARGGFHIDPWQPVERALITHAHADHARPGSVSYLCAAPCAPLLAARVGAGAEVRSLAYGETLTLDGPGPGSGGVGGGIAVSF